MKVLVSEKLSPHKFKTPEGYLICTDAILARTGKQTYRRSEVFQDGDDTEIDVDRSEDEVFSEATLASFENKPITLEHPDEDVNVDNHNRLAVGFLRDVHKGDYEGQPVMMGTLVITDAEAIEAVESGELEELSCGYNCDISDDEHPSQKNIRGNHLALCKSGRAGIARIVDSKSIKDTDLKVGQTFVARSGARLVVKGISSGFSDYNGEAYVKIKYYYVSASGKKSGISEASTYDFWKMLTDASLTGDSIKDEKCTESQLRSAKLGTKVTHQGKTFIKTDDPDLPWHNVDDRSHKMSAYALAQMNGGCTLADAYAKGDKLQHVEGDKEEIVSVINESTFNGKTVKKYVMKSGKKYLAEDIESSSWKKVHDSELELPEEEDSEFRYYDAYGQEIHVVNWDGRNQFMVIHKGKEMMMNRRDTEYYLDRQGAKFSKVIRDSIKDAIFEICYIKNGDIRIMMQGKSEEDVRKKFWNQYGAYYIKSIKKIRDANTQEEVTKGMKKNLKNFEDAKYRVGQTVMYRGEKSRIVKIEHDDKYGYDLLIVNPFYKSDGKSDEMIWVGENVKTIDCKDISDCDYSNVENSVKDAIQPSHDNIREQIVYVMQSDIDKNLYFYIGTNYAMREGEWTYQQYKMNGMLPDELKKELEASGWHKVAKGPAPFIDSVKDMPNLGTIKKSSHIPVFEGYAKKYMNGDESIKSQLISELQALTEDLKYDTSKLPKEFMSEVKSNYRAVYILAERLYRLYRMSEAMQFMTIYSNRLNDSVNDAMQNFEITWLDTYKKSKGYPKDEWRFVAEIKANSLKDALQKLAAKVALGGVGTANAFVVSIHSDNKSYQFSGKLSDLLRRTDLTDSKTFVVNVNGKKYKTQAKDSIEAVQNIKKIVRVKDFAENYKGFTIIRTNSHYFIKRNDGKTSPTGFPTILEAKIFIDDNSSLLSTEKYWNTVSESKLNH